MTSGVVKIAASAFFAKAERVASGCWEWRRSTFATGYGKAWDGERVTYAHRVAFRLAVGAIPDGADVCHSCDNRLCVNPEHLFVGTRADNVRDCIAKGRFSYPRFDPATRRGELNPCARMTRETVAEAKRRHAAGESLRSIARGLGVAAETVRRAVRGESWRTS